MNRTASVASAVALTAAFVGLALWLKFDDWVVLPRAQQQMANRLSDPLSAQFRSDFLVDENWHCGEVNAKNGMGGYSGFKRFISGRASNVVYLEGIGMLGKETTEEIMLVLDKETAYLKAMNSLKAASPDLRITLESETRRREQARSEVFEDHWKAICLKN